MKLFLGISLKSWSWALAFNAGSMVGPMWDRPAVWLAAMMAAALVGSAIEYSEWKCARATAENASDGEKKAVTD